MERLIAGAKRLGLHLTAEQVARFEVYYQELMEWNKQINLTAIIDYGEVQVKHFLDSLTVVMALNTDAAKKRHPSLDELLYSHGVPSLSVLDVGSGAGLPGVPLKIVCPAINLTLLDSVAKRTRFLHHLVRKLDMGDVEIVTARAEDLARDGRYREQFDLVLSRAVAALPSLVELTVPFCKIGGMVVAQKKGEIEEEIARATRAIAVVGGRLQQVKKVELGEFVEQRVLVIIDKVAPTPKQYPRRAGIPSRRPL